MKDMNATNGRKGMIYWLSAPSGSGKTPWLRHFVGKDGRYLTDEALHALLLAQTREGQDSALVQALSLFPRVGLDDLDLLLSGRSATEEALRESLFALTDAGVDAALAGIALDRRLPAFRAALAERLGERFRVIPPEELTDI